MVTVLVVDDSAVDRVFVGGLLAKEENIGLNTPSTAQALPSGRGTARYRHHDLLMPHIDGLELVSTVRGRFRWFP